MFIVSLFAYLLTSINDALFRLKLRKSFCDTIVYVADIFKLININKVLRAI